MKKTTILLLLTLFCIISLFPQATDPPPWLGDVNGNQSIDIVDALITAQYYVGLTTDPLIHENGDANWDGNVDIIDALLIAQFYVGLMEYLPGDDVYGRTQKDLAKNSRKWKNLLLWDYQIECRVQNINFPYSSDTFVVNVETTYLISAYFKDTNVPIDEAWLNDLITVDELFDILQRVIDARSIIHDIQFNEEFGYISRLDYEASEDIVDDRSTYEIFSIRSYRDIQITNREPAHLLKDFFKLYQPKIFNNLLYMPIEYNGGCKIHEFILYAHDAFLESDPVQVNLYLYHDAFNDPCYAIPVDCGGFNLEPLAELYHSYYQSYDTMILNIHTYDINDPDPVAFSIPYTPIIPDYSISVNDTFTITHSTQPSTGYGWFLTIENTDILSLNNDYIDNCGSMAGSPCDHHFVLRGKKSGTTKLTFEYYRDFEDPPVSINTREYLVEVTD